MAEDIDAERAAFNEWFDETMYRETARDAMEAAWLAARRTPSASIGEDGLPELPPPCSSVLPSGWIRYTADQMRQFRAEGIAADRRAREVTVTNYGNPVDKSPQAAQGVKRWQDRLPSTHVPTTSDFVQARDEEIADLRAQLARQSQEPVAWLYKWIGAYGVRKPGDIIARTPAELGGHVDLHPRNWERLSPLYAAPTLSSEQQAEYREALEMCVKALEHSGLGKSTRERALQNARRVLGDPQPGDEA